MSTASSIKFITVMTLIASDMPRRLTAAKTAVVSMTRSGTLAPGHRYVLTVNAKMTAYMAQASVLPIQKNQPVKKASGRAWVRATNE